MERKTGQEVGKEKIDKKRLIYFGAFGVMILLIFLFLFQSCSVNTVDIFEKQYSNDENEPLKTNQNNSISNTGADSFVSTMIKSPIFYLINGLFWFFFIRKRW